MAKKVLPDRYEPLYALFNSETGTQLEKAKLAAVLEFMTHMDLNAKPRPDADKLFNETVRYVSRLERSLRGQGPIDDFTGNLLRAGALAVELRGGARMQAGAKVGEAFASFSFVQHYAADAKDLDAAQKQAVFATNVSPLLEGRTQSFWSTARGSEPLAQAAARLSAIGKVIPPIPLTDDAALTADVSTAAVLTFDEGHVFGNAAKVLKNGTKNQDGSLTVNVDALRKALKRDFRKISKDVHDVNEKVLAELAEMKAQDQQVVDWVESQRKVEAERKKAEEEGRRRTEIVEAAMPVIAAAEAGLGAVVAVLGLADPKAAQQVARVGGALINVGKAGVQMVQAAVNLAAATAVTVALGLTMAVCTFNFIAAAAALISIFLPSGPDPRELIEEIGKLREEMRKYHEYVAERFNAIDRSLDKIYGDVMGKLDKIDLELRQLDAKADRVLVALARQSASLDRIEQDLLLYLKEGKRQDLREAMRSALLRTSRSERPTMTGAEYQAFEAKFLSWAVDNSRGPTESPVGPTEERALYARLDPHGNGGTVTSMALVDHLALAVKAARDRGWPELAAEPGKVVPNPRTWMVAAAAFTQLESEWPQHAARFNSLDLDGRRRLVRAAGQEVTGTIANIENARDAQRRTVIDLARENVQAHADALAKEIEDWARSWRWLGLPVYVTEDLPAAPDLLPLIKPPLAGTDIPAEAVRRLPTIYRAVALSVRPGSPDGAPRGGLTTTHDQRHDWKWVDTDGGHYTRLELTINFLGLPVHHYKLIGRWQGPVPRDLAAQWPVWRDQLVAPTAQPTNVANRNTTMRVEAAWNQVRTEIRKTQMLPQLAESLGAGGSLSDYLANYGGARALLALYVGLAMPRARQRSDRLRAAFDGLPKFYGGIAIPTPDLLLAMIAGGNLAGMSVRHDSRAIENVIKAQVADSLWALDDFLKARRKHVPPGSRIDPALTECFARMELSRKIVHVADRLAKTS